MKNLLYTFCGSMILLLAGSCSGFLEEENLSTITAEDFYVTQEGYEALINSTYATLRDIYEPTPYMFCAGTDLYFGAHQDAPLGLTTYQSLTPGTTQVGDFFQTLYESIQVCNTAIHYAGETESFSELDSRVAEARFLRAYYYFLLVQTFGDVSLVTEMVDEPITHFDRAPADQVYTFIIDELELAEEALSDTQTDFGRVTKRAAQHMLAKVYLTRGYEEYGQPTDFETAASYADQAINGQSLGLTFDELFAYENDVNSEVILSVQYDQSSLLNGGRHNWDHPWGPLITGTDDGVSKKNILHPTEYLFTVFGEYDSRFEGTFLNIRTSPYAAWILDPDNTPIVYYFPRTAEQLADTVNWRAADPANRDSTSIVPIGEHWWSSTNQEDYPSLRKFDRNTEAEVPYTHDLYLARLGETYLIAAEAYFMDNDLPTAMERINEVRRRAAMPGHEADMLITQADLSIDFILDERARELAGEGFRWFDLKRTGKLMERTKLYNPEIRSLVDSGIDPFLGLNGHYKILRPIPLSAISLDDGEYPQNPAYQ